MTYPVAQYLSLCPVATHPVALVESFVVVVVVRAIDLVWAIKVCHAAGCAVTRSL